MRREVIDLSEGMSKLRLVLLIWVLTPVTSATTDQRFSTNARKLSFYCFNVIELLLARLMQGPVSFCSLASKCRVAFLLLSEKKHFCPVWWNP